ncbi:MAG TPA: hypothetical protein VF107_08415 [Burkholderiaceae bacterium]
MADPRACAVAEPDPHLRSQDALMPFLSIVLPTLFVLGVLPDRHRARGFYLFERWRFEHSKPMLGAIGSVHSPG